MKILVLTSRYTALRDIIDEDFGRQTRLFSELKRLGHEIHMLCADYKKFESKKIKLHGMDVSSVPFNVFFPFPFLMTLNKTIKKEKPQLIIGSGDPLWGVVGYYFSRKFEIRFLYDLHDNYEVYQSYRMIPFFKYIDKYVMKRVDIVTTVSQTLKNKIKRGIRKNAFVIPNGFEPSVFKPMNKEQCRKKLGLPKSAKIIAYAGRIGGKFEKNQSIIVLIKAFEIVRNKFPDTYLTVMGQWAYKDINWKHRNLIFLGSGDQKKVAMLINAADVAVVPNPDNDFTRYCFPYKIVEYMACKTPVVATDVGDVKLLLEKHKWSLCRFSPGDMADKIIRNLNKGKVDYKIEEYSWKNIAKRLDKIIK